MASNDSWKFLVSLGVHHRTWDDPVFAAGLHACAPLTKLPCVDLDDEEFLHTKSEPVRCGETGCTKTFSTVVEQASHHRACHSHVCSCCRLSFPSNHLLDLHLLEFHDSLFQLMAEKKPMYACLQESCPHTFMTPAERKTHCMEEHGFPYDFRFDPLWRKLCSNTTSTNKNNNNSRNKLKQQSKEESLSMECETIGTEAEDNRCTDSVRKQGVNAGRSTKTTKRVSPIKMPHHISFGCGTPRGFVRGNRHHRGQHRSQVYWHEKKRPAHSLKTNIEEVNMKELEEALPISSVCH